MKGEFRDPQDERLGRLTDAMLVALEAHPEYGEDVSCVIFLQDNVRGGLQLHGYKGDDQRQSSAAVADVLLHLQAIFEANGHLLVIAPLHGEQ